MPPVARLGLTVREARVDEQPPFPLTFGNLQLPDEFRPEPCMQHTRQFPRHRKSGRSPDEIRSERRCWQGKVWLTMQHVHLLGAAVPNVVSAARPRVSSVGSVGRDNVRDL